MGRNVEIGTCGWGQQSARHIWGMVSSGTAGMQTNQGEQRKL